MTISLMFGFLAVAVLGFCIILLLFYVWKMKQLFHFLFRKMKEGDDEWIHW